MKIFYIGLFFAASLWFLMFSSFPSSIQIIHNQYFWYAMTASTLSLTIFGLIAQKDKLKTLFSFQWKYIYIGLGHALILLGMSHLGVYLLRTIFPYTNEMINHIYITRTQLNSSTIGLLLFFIIAPCEEIFWRGFIQEKLTSFYNPKKGFITTVVLYAMVHVWSFNPILLLAAMVLGLHWGFLYRKFGSIIPGIISHAVWDTLIFVVLPVKL